MASPGTQSTPNLTQAHLDYIAAHRATVVEALNNLQHPKVPLPDSVMNEPTEGVEGHNAKMAKIADLAAKQPDDTQHTYLYVAQIAKYVAEIDELDELAARIKEGGF